MSYQEPDDPIEAVCTECGEEEHIEHVIDAQWRCFICEDTFSDGSNFDDSDFHNLD